MTGGIEGRIDVHAHFLTEPYAAACRAAGHGQPDGIPALSVSSPGVHFGGRT